MKTCTNCKKSKSLDLFGVDSRRSDGLFIHCRLCRSKKRKAYRATVEGNNYSKNMWLKDRYGITLDQYDEAFKIQGGLCGLCDRVESQIDKRNNKIRRLSVDHCHVTGVNRGLLCGECNLVLGKLEKGLPWLTQLPLDYLNAVTEKYQLIRLILIHHSSGLSNPPCSSDGHTVDPSALSVN